MEKATEIFEKHWTKATGKPLDETTKHHMKYAIEAINEALLLGAVSGSLPCIVEAGVMAVKISEMVKPSLTAQKQSFFIAGFCECVKWLGSNDR